MIVAGLAVAHLLGDRDDLGVETSLVAGAGGELLGPEPVGIQFLAGNVPLVGNHLGAETLRDEASGVGVAIGHRIAEGEPGLLEHLAGPKRNHAHHLDARCDGDVVSACDHTLSGEVGRLLGGSTLAVDRGCGNRLGPSGRKHGIPPDVETLSADLHDTTHDHIVDELGVQVVPVGQSFQYFGSQVGGMPAGQLTETFAHGRADSINDDGFWHPTIVLCTPGRRKIALSERRRRAATHRLTKLEIIVGPPTVSTDSGWNWTPSTSTSRWRIPMMMPSELLAVTSNASGRSASLHDQRVVPGRHERRRVGR